MKILKYSNYVFAITMGKNERTKILLNTDIQMEQVVSLFH